MFIDALTYEQCFALVCVLIFILGVLVDRTMLTFYNMFVLSEDEDKFVE